MKNLLKLIGFIALVAVIGFSMAGCGDLDPGGGPQKATYVSEDDNGNKYTLEIEETGGRSARSARSAAQPGDYFKLTVEYSTALGSGNLNMKFEYTGNVGAAQASGETVKLTLDLNGERITITIVGTQMDVITGKIVDPKNGNVVSDDAGYITPVSLRDGADSALNGTWINKAGEIWVLNNGNLAVTVDGDESVEGKYTTSGNYITVTFTRFKGHLFGSDGAQFGISANQWYTRQKFKTALMQALYNAGYTQSRAEREVEELLRDSGLYEPMSGPYSLSNNNNTLNIDGAILTRYGSGGGHTHSYKSTWEYDDTHHWRECTANDGATTGFASHTGNPCSVCAYSADYSLNGVWYRGDNNVISIVGSEGYFTVIDSEWKTVADKGGIGIGSLKFQNITKTGTLTWSAQQLLHTGSSVSGMSDCTIVMDADGNTFTVFDSDANSTKDTSIYRRGEGVNTSLLNGIWDRGDGNVITIIGDIGYFTVIDSGWKDVEKKGGIGIGSLKFKDIVSTGTLTWSANQRIHRGSSDGGFSSCTITMTSDYSTFRVYDPSTTQSEDTRVYNRRK